MLVAKSNYIRKLVVESDDTDLTRIKLSNIPGGPEIFEKAAKFCYGVNFEITVHNVAALRCAAEYLEMTDQYCSNNLAGRTDDFLAHVALTSLSGAIVVLKSCEDLLPAAEDLKIVQRCVDVASLKVRVLLYYSLPENGQKNFHFQTSSSGNITKVRKPKLPGPWNMTMK